MKSGELRDKTKAQLSEELMELRKEQFNLRMQRGSGQLANPSRFRQVRVDIARIKTVMNEKSRTQS